MKKQAKDQASTPKVSGKLEDLYGKPQGLLEAEKGAMTAYQYTIKTHRNPTKSSGSCWVEYKIMGNGGLVGHGSFLPQQAARFSVWLATQSFAKPQSISCLVARFNREDGANVTVLLRS